MEHVKKSLLEMAGGGFMEHADLEVARILNNIYDPNTKATAKRKLTLTFEFIPDDSRSNIIVKSDTKVSLAPTNSVMTTLWVSGEDGTGELTAVELTPNIPGQTNIFDGEEQEPPAVLRLINY